MKKTITQILLIFLSLILITGCPTSIPTSGSLTVSVSAPNAWEGNVICAITGGSNDLNLSFSFSSSSSAAASQTVTLEAGTYTLTFSGSGLATQTQNVTVTAGDTAQCSVTMSEPAATTGSVRVTITAPSTAVSNLTARITALNGGSSNTTINLSAISGSRYRGTFSDLAPDYYLLSILNGGNTVGQTVFKVNAGDSLKTTGRYTGSALFWETVDTASDALAMSINIDNTYLLTSDTLSATATIDKSGTYLYEWYLNEKRIGEAETLSYDLSNTTAGTYQLQVAALASDYSAVSSAYVTVTIGEAYPDTTSVTNALAPFENKASQFDGTMQMEMSGALALNSATLEEYDSTTKATVTFATAQTTSNLVFSFDMSQNSSYTGSGDFTMSGAFDVAYSDETPSASYEFTNLKMRMESGGSSYSVTYTSSDTFKKDGTEVSAADRDTECMAIMRVLMAGISYFDESCMTMSDCSSQYNYSVNYYIDSSVEGFEGYILTGSLDSSCSYDITKSLATGGQSTADLTISDASGNETSLVVKGTFFQENITDTDGKTATVDTKTVTGVSLNGYTIDVSTITTESDCYNYLINYIGIGD